MLRKNILLFFYCFILLSTCGNRQNTEDDELNINNFSNTAKTNKGNVNNNSHNPNSLQETNNNSESKNTANSEKDNTHNTNIIAQNDNYIKSLNKNKSKEEVDNEIQYKNEILKLSKSEKSEQVLLLFSEIWSLSDQILNKNLKSSKIDLEAKFKTLEKLKNENKLDIETFNRLNNIKTKFLNSYEKKEDNDKLIE
ncbi:MAG: hypothetical protein GY830_07455, partial [Bacteroidetes bacterium]|nr:hypothetical protein [Bacteroidota bacterium]